MCSSHLLKKCKGVFRVRTDLVKCISAALCSAHLVDRSGLELFVVLCSKRTCLLLKKAAHISPKCFRFLHIRPFSRMCFFCRSISESLKPLLRFLTASEAKMLLSRLHSKFSVGWKCMLSSHIRVHSPKIKCLLKISPIRRVKNVSILLSHKPSRNSL